MLVVISATALATTYDVGDGKPYTSIGAVPWESLNAGDTVNIYYRSTPYKEKFVLGRVGTQSQPITVHGVPGPGGELPVLDGQSATTRLALETGSEARGLITMQQWTTTPPSCHPSYIVIENLEIKNASTPYTFTDDAGATVSYVASSAAIWITDCRNVTVRNCYFHDCGNGFFTYTEGSGADCWSEGILVEGCYITNCGNAGSTQEHDSYTESDNIIFQYNRYGPPRGGDTQAIGNALKDRSAGLVVRYNWIEGGNRCMDIIDCEDSSTLGTLPEWDKVYMYGNVLIERPDAGNRQVVHFGKDMHAEPRHKGYFYNNTLVSLRPSGSRTTLVRESGSSSGFFDVRNCILYVQGAGSDLEINNDSKRGGPVNIRNLWMKPGYDPVGPSGGTTNDYGSHVLGTDPGLVDLSGQDFHLASGSGCINAGTTLHADASAYPVTMQYVKHQDGETRPSDGTLDIGAFEFAGGPPPDLVITTTSLPAGTVGVAYSATLEATGGVPAYTWSVVSGSLPNGLSLGSSTGIISGTPTASGTSYFTVQVADSQQPADTDTQALSITVNAAPPAPTITTTSLPSGTRGTPYSATVQATGGTLPYAWSIVSGSLPTGLSLNSSTGVISGTPKKKGTKSFTIRCTDAMSQYDDQALSITIN